MTRKNYNKGKIREVILSALDSAMVNNPDKVLLISPLRDYLDRRFPEPGDKCPDCPNCGASMVQYQFVIDVLDVALVVEMAKKVRERLEKFDDGDFTKANSVHVPSLTNLTLAQRCRTTRCAKFGLIAKKLDSKRHVGGEWVITTRGFEALRGMEIPKAVTVFRNQIIEHHEEKTTFARVIAARNIKVDPKLSGDVLHFEPDRWNFVVRAGIAEGKLL